MQLYNFARATVRQVPEPRINHNNLALFLIDFPDMSYKEYTRIIKCQIEEQLDTKILLENSSLDIELFSNVDLDFNEINQIYNNTTSVIVNWLTQNNEVREQEWRLAAPHQLCMIYTQIMHLLNYKTRIECFNIRLFYKDYEISMTEC